jgi:hypothetical protein
LQCFDHGSTARGMRKPAPGMQCRHRMTTKPARRPRYVNMTMPTEPPGFDSVCCFSGEVCRQVCPAISWTYTLHPRNDRFALRGILMAPPARTRHPPLSLPIPGGKATGAGSNIKRKTLINEVEAALSGELRATHPGCQTSNIGMLGARND